MSSKNSARLDEPWITGRESGHQSKEIEILFDRYGHIIYLVCLKYLKSREDSRDAVMDIFQKLLTDGGLEGIENIPAWLHTITKNHCLMKLRRADRSRTDLISPADMDNLLVENPDPVHLTLDPGIRWEPLLDSLEYEQQACIRLFYYEEKSYREISEIRGLTLKGVKSHIQNGKRNLKNMLLKKQGRAS